MKRHLGHNSGSDESMNLFDITSYKINTLENFIGMINDYVTKKLPKKKHRANYPMKMDILPDILLELN